MDFYGLATPVESATNARPGTKEKIAVLAERAGREQELWHPDDGKRINVKKTSVRPAVQILP